MCWGDTVRDESEKEDGDRLKGSVVCGHQVYHRRSLSPEQGLGLKSTFPFPTRARIAKRKYPVVEETEVVGDELYGHPLPLQLALCPPD